MSQPKVVVTGGGGFIGGHLVGALLAQGREVRCVDCKPTDEWYQVHENAENVIADLQELDACRMVCDGMDECYQLASDMGGIGFIEHHKALCMLSVLITTHMLLAAKEHGLEAFFYSSSACVYNADKQKSEDSVPLREADAYPAMPEDGYGWEKLFSERLCRHFRRISDCAPGWLGITTCMAHLALGREAGRKLPQRSVARWSTPSAPAASASRSGATASRPDPSCTLTTA